MEREKVNYTDANDLLFDLAFYKQKASILMDLFNGSDDPVLHRRAEKMLACGTLIALGHEAEGFAITGANFCRQRLCPMCQYRRSVRLAELARKRCNELTADGFAFLHLVLTVRNCAADDLGSTLTRMNRAFSRMIKDPALKAFKGSLRCTEVTYNALTGEYHPHFHCLIAVKRSYFKSRYYVRKDTIIQLWRSYMLLDYDPSVHIGVADEHAVGEVCKYCVKPFDLAVRDPAELLLVYQTFDIVLGGRRLLQCHGIFKGAFSKALDEADALEENNSDALDLFGNWRYNYSEGVYERVG